MGCHIFTPLTLAIYFRKQSILSPSASRAAAQIPFWEQSNSANFVKRMNFPTNGTRYEKSLFCSQFGPFVRHFTLHKLKSRSCRKVRTTSRNVSHVDKRLRRHQVMFAKQLHLSHHLYWKLRLTSSAIGYGKSQHDK